MTLDSLIEQIDKKLSDLENEKLDAEKNKVLAAVDLKHVLDTHHVLKKKLQDALNNTAGANLDVATLSQDNLCAIGKWLYGTGKILYGHLPEYETARKIHAELHVCAGEVLSQHYIGDKEQAKLLFKTKFRSISSRNQLEFTRLFSAAKR
jgi:hypothetical protein